MKTLLATSVSQPAKPLLKWVGGKSQMLNDILPLIPSNFNKYIEPFFGGGALFFSMNPAHAVIADLNDELINLYQTVKTHPEELVALLKKFKNSSEDFYNIRSKDRSELSAAEMAARTIYLNRTCFNGLYRVNKKGHFNVPFGKYVNPKICNEENIYAASLALQDTQIFCGDYKSTLKTYAAAGDLIFLDPPYLPISASSDFTAYTKAKFYEADHVELANEVKRLHELGCHVILTNSNHPLVYDLYAEFNIDVIKTRRSISSNAAKRVGEDVIVNIPPGRK